MIFPYSRIDVDIGGRENFEELPQEAKKYGFGNNHKL